MAETVVGADQVPQVEEPAVVATLELAETAAMGNGDKWQRLVLVVKRLTEHLREPT
jgi:hypothetical protein